MKTFKEHLSKKLKDEKFATLFREEEEKLRIAYEIHQTRTQHGWTQKELAERAGVTQQMVSRLENAASPSISLKTVWRVSRALGLEVGLVPPSSSIAHVSALGTSTNWKPVKQP